MKKTNFPSARANDMMVGTYFWKDGKVVQINARNIFDCWRDKHEFNPIEIDIAMLKNIGCEFYFAGSKSYQHVRDVCIKSTNDKDWLVGFKTALGTVSWTKTYLNYMHQFQILCLEINGEMPDFGPRIIKCSNVAINDPEDILP